MPPERPDKARRIVRQWACDIGGIAADEPRLQRGLDQLRIGLRARSAPAPRRRPVMPASVRTSTRQMETSVYVPHEVTVGRRQCLGQRMGDDVGDADIGAACRSLDAPSVSRSPVHPGRIEPNASRHAATWQLKNLVAKLRAGDVILPTVALDNLRGAPMSRGVGQKAALLRASRLRPARLADTVSDAIAAALFDGRIAPGEALPAEGEIASEFGVSKPIAREALRQLTAAGLIFTQQGKVARAKAMNGEADGAHLRLRSALEPAAAARGQRDAPRDRDGHRPAGGAAPGQGWAGRHGAGAA